MDETTSTKCKWCPLEGAESPCPAIELNHARYCQLVDPNHPNHNADYPAVLLAMAASHRPNGRLAWRTTTIPSVDPDQPADKPKGPASTAAGRRKNPLELLELVHECDYRGARLGCGCEDLRQCGLGKGPTPTHPFQVSRSDCLRCVSQEKTTPENAPIDGNGAN